MKNPLDGFASIYQRFRHPILHYVKSRVRDEEVAEELTQEIFLKAYRFGESYKEKYAITTWLWTIASNTVTDHLRGLKTWLGADSAMADGALCPEQIPCPGKTAEALVLKKERRRKVLRLLRSLTKLQKRVLWMRLIHQLSYPEISKRLGLSLSAVKNLAHRAKRALGEHEPALAAAFAV